MIETDDPIHLKWKMIDPENPKTWPAINRRVLIERDDGWVAFMMRNLNDCMRWALYPRSEPISIKRFTRYAVVPEDLMNSRSRRWVP